MSDGQTGLAQAIQEVSENAQILVREEIELAKAEVTAKALKLAKGAGIGAAAGLFVLGALLMLLHGFAWLAADLLNSVYWGFFLVAGVLLVLGAIAGFIAARLLKAGSPPAPQMAIEEAKLIRETVTSDTPRSTV
jgi:hypothetical protein